MENALEIEKTAYDASYGQLRSQKEDLKSFRAQASFCAAISGLVATAFATIAADNLFSGDARHQFLGVSLYEWLVLITFVLSIAFAILAIVDWRTVRFELSPKTALHFSKHYDHYPEEGFRSAEAQLYALLATEADEFFNENEEVIDRIKTYIFMSLFFAFAQIPAWVILAVSVQ